MKLESENKAKKTQVRKGEYWNKDVLGWNEHNWKLFMFLHTSRNGIWEHNALSCKQIG